MMENGRILHHLRPGSERSAEYDSGSRLSGRAATLGRRVVERQPVLQIFGEDVPLHARVEVIDGYSAHADRTEMTNWLGKVRTNHRGSVRYGWSMERHRFRTNSRRH